MSSYSEDFNGADTSPLPNFTAQTANVLRRLSNVASPTTTGSYSISSYNSSMASDDVKASLTVGPSTGASDIFLLMIRGDNTKQAYLLLQHNTLCNIQTKVSAWGSLTGFTNRANATSMPTVTAGDVFDIEAIGNVYRIYKNGVFVTGAQWIDSGAAFTGYSKGVGIGVNASAAGRGIDAWQAADQGLSKGNFFAMF